MEYTTFLTYVSDDTLGTRLSDLSGEGWEVSHFVPCGVNHTSLLVVMRRYVPSEEDDTAARERPAVLACRG